MSWQNAYVIIAASMLLLGLIGAVIGIQITTKIASIFVSESRLVERRIPRRWLFVIEFVAALVAPIAMFVSIPIVRHFAAPGQSGGYIAMGNFAGSRCAGQYVWGKDQLDDKCAVISEVYLANFRRRLTLPSDVKHWSLMTLREKLVKNGAKVTRHAKYVTFQLAEVAIPRKLFVEILDRIERLALPPPVVARCSE